MNHKGVIEAKGMDAKPRSRGDEPAPDLWAKVYPTKTPLTRG